MDEVIITSRAEAEVAAEAPEAEETIAEGAGDRREAFDKLVRGEYKAEFDERVKRIIDKRFRETKQLKERAERARPLYELLQAKYGESDEGKLAELIRAEGEQPAREAALTDENEKLRAENKALAREQRARTTLNKWRADAEEARRAYPAFDIKRELDDPRFASLLRAGVDVKTAYEAAHSRELMAEAMRLTAEKVREQTVNDIRARGLRPIENGAGGRGASPVAPARVEDMTRAQREAIEKRCARGEKVYFD